eukprot:TRINITY_DN3854_c0_g2_i4.p1 TRINITY_DN3854_c0_g2~~TRINITY_DN3854_c0_g2_i4.p1  ORF type:complete len:347 (+),score=92.66 TRINITY_DN3854_c0_g2_i4:169-1209(+)
MCIRDRSTGKPPGNGMDPNEAIQNFCAITGMDDVGVAMGMLETANWNLEVAINTFLVANEGGMQQPAAGGHSGASHGSGDGRFNSEQLDENVWKVVEDDQPYGQYPFIYVILGADKCIMVDTGSGTGNLCEFVSSTINTAGLPYYVVNTHVHFDHVGGNHDFEAGGNCTALAMSGAHQVFSKNVEINSLCMAHGCSVKAYTVTRWLEEGDFVYLDDTNPSMEHALCVLNTPGHTPDSIALHYPHRNRLFAGDTLYPFTAMHLDCIGSNVDDYQTTLTKLQEFTADKEGIRLCAGHVEANIQPSAIQQVQGLVAEVLAGVNQPVRVDDGYGEYTDGMYSIMMKIPGN